MLSPWCFGGRLLKLRPKYDADAEEGVNQAAMSAQEIVYR